MTINKNLSALTINELYAEKKKSKGVLIGLGSLMIIACALLVFVAIKSKNYALIGVACSCSITLLPMMTRLGQIEKEIKKRVQE